MSEQLSPVAGTKLSELLRTIPPEQETPYFKILMDRALSPDELITVHSPSRINYPERVEETFEHYWQQELRRNPKTFNGLKVRLDTLGFRNDGRFLLELSDTDYRSYRGSLYLADSELDSISHELPHPLGAAIIIRSEIAFHGQGGILFAQRSADITHRPLALEFPAGNIEHEHINVRGEIDPLKGIVKELDEEQAIRPREVSNLKVLGIAYEHFGDAAPMLIASGELLVDPEEILRRPRDGEGRPIWVPNDPDKIMEMALHYSIISLPLVGASLYLLLRQNSPDAAESFLQILRQRQTFENDLDSVNFKTLERICQTEFDLFY
jgi:hypothetical protein